MNKNHLDIIVISNELEALAIRACLEWWGVITRIFFVSKSQDLINILSGKEKLSPHVLLACHGTKKGIVLPELDKNIAKQQPYNKFITPTNLKNFLKLNKQIILSNGCKTGTAEFANVFLKSGAKIYIAPKDYLEGNISLLYVINFYYFLFVKKLSVNDAYNKTKLIISEGETFEFFKI